MLPGTQATLVSKMRVTYPPYGASEGLARFVHLEYGGDWTEVRAMIAQADRVRSARKANGFGRAILRVLARIPEALAAGTPGGA